MQTDKLVKDKWTEHWNNKKNLEESASSLGIFLRKQRIKILSKMLNNFHRDLSIIDIGCGGGSILSVFKDLGFKNVTGIDFVEDSMKHCEKLGFIKGKDVFLMDAKNTKFPDEAFDIVFSEGLWEHFQDPRPYMTEATRITKKVIVVIQPNHFSPFGKLMNIGWNLFSQEKGGIKEYSFTLGYFKDFLKLYGFKLTKSKSTILNEQAIMQFERR